MKFAVREIKEQNGLVFSGPVPVEDYAREGLFGEARIERDCILNLEFSVGGSRILMEGRVEGAWTLPCSRCLGLHEAPLTGELEETYPISQETIDVGEDVRQALVLGLPQKSLCREDCKGLCPKCGKNLNEGACACAAR